MFGMFARKRHFYLATLRDPRGETLRVVGVDRLTPRQFEARIDDMVVGYSAMLRRQTGLTDHIQRSSSPLSPLVLRLGEREIRICRVRSGLIPRMGDCQ